MINSHAISKRLGEGLADSAIERPWSRHSGELYSWEELGLGALEEACGSTDSTESGSMGSLVAHSEKILLGAVQALAHALEAKDAYTSGHSARVSSYSVAIARAMGGSLIEVEEVALGAALHDVGKIGIPEQLLRKPGPLTAAEHLCVMEHTVIGERILTPLLESRPRVLQIVRSHHERVDGRGTPDGLQGDAIPMFARIVAVADAFDAMTSARPYRASLDPCVALRELDDNAGTQLDPACVAAFYAVLLGSHHPSEQEWTGLKSIAA